MFHRTSFLPVPTVLLALLLGACASQPPSQTPPSQTPPSPSSPDRRVYPPPQPPAPAAAPEVQKSHLDQLQGALTSALHGQDVEITRQSDRTLLLRIPGAMAFAANDAKPQPALLSLLDKLADALKREPDTQVTIEGHTDSLGREVVNQTLSVRRADQVVAYLASKGIAYDRLHAAGKGESQPIADNATEAGRARNRRVDILITGG